MSSAELKKLKYHISVLAISFTPVILHFTVDEFAIAEKFLVFTDEKTGLRKWFPIDMCMIEEVDNK